VTKPLVVSIFLFAIGISCQQSKMPPNIDHKEVNVSPREHCLIFSQLIDQQAPLVLTNKDDPQAVLIEFSWATAEAGDEGKLDCYYKFH